MSNSKLITRRKLLCGVAASTALVSLPIRPANAFFIESIVTFLVRVPWVRLATSFIFNQVGTFLIRCAYPNYMQRFSQGRPLSKRALPKPHHSIADIAGEDISFSHPLYSKHVRYKASVITLEETEYKVHNKNIELLLSSNKKIEIKRFEIVRDYLKDNHVRVKLADYEYSQPVTSGITPDQVMGIEYFSDLKHSQERHIQEMITATKVDVFKKLV